MPLKEYCRKRDFSVTSEPSGQSHAVQSSARQLRYVIQKHRASQLHYDFRLEWNGVMLSWAVPKGPSLDASVKRLAMQVEDHPVEYSDFERVIARGQYGGGIVMIWDTGTWVPESAEVDTMLKKGELKFILDGKKLRGSWVLIRTRGYGKNAKRSSWLLLKHRDVYAREGDITVEQPRSAVSNRTLEEIARDEGGDVARAATGDRR